MTDEEKNKHRMAAVAAYNDRQRYERLMQNAEDMEEHEMWSGLRDRAHLKLTLTLSVLEVENV